MLVCAIDIGTSSVRTALVDRSGHIVAAARTSRTDSARQFDPETLWRQLVNTLAQLTSKADGAAPVAVAVAGHVGNVLLDEYDVPVVTAGGWSDDRGVGKLRDAWQNTPGQWARTGRPSATGGAVATLCWLAEHDPAAAGRVRSVLTPKDYLNLRLTGGRGTDVTSAAYLLGLDVFRRSWDEHLLHSLGLDPAIFPELHYAGDILGTIEAEVSRATGLPSGIPVSVGGPDGTVGAAAILGTRIDSIVDIAGTTDVLVQVTATPPAAGATQAIVNPYVVPGLWTHGGATGMTGGAVTAWLSLLHPDPQAKNRLAEQAVKDVTPGSDGLLALPHFTGSRFPVWRDDERASLVGLSPRHQPAHILQAVIEGAAFSVREGLDLLDPSGELNVVLAGGLARSPELLAIRADVFGRRIYTQTSPDASLLGAARVAQISAGIIADLDDAMPESKTQSAVVPNSDRAALYTDLFHRWRSTRQALLSERLTPIDSNMLYGS